jgi:hypothetical protein
LYLVLRFAITSSIPILLSQFWTSSIFLSYISKNVTFRRIHCLSFQGQPPQIGPIERASLFSDSSKFKFKFKLYCDGRPVGLFVLVSRPLRYPWAAFNFLCFTTAFLFFMSVGCSAITHWIEPRRTHNHILLPLLRLPQPRGPGPAIYIIT